MTTASHHPVTGDRRRWLASMAGVWLSGAGWAVAAEGEPVLILTEEFPPYNFTQDGKLTGLAPEVIEAMLQQMGLKGRFQSLPWARAYETAINVPGVLLCSVVRTPEREQRFKWVGAIAASEYYLFSLASKPIELDSLDDARSLQIGTVTLSAGEQFLLSKGFAKGHGLQSVARNEPNYEKLRKGHIDLWIMNQLTAHYLVRKAGRDPVKALHKSLAIAELSTQHYYVALGAGTPDSDVARFRNAFDAVARDGSLERLLRKWQ